MLYQVTGNEYLSLPTIREDNGAVEGITFLYMQAKGMLEMRGTQGLIAPYLAKGGERVTLNPKWNRIHYWIPCWTAEHNQIFMTCTYLTPMEERGLGIRICALNKGKTSASIRIGMNGSWDHTLHEINETVEITQGRYSKPSGWNDMFVWSQQAGLPLFAFAPITEDNQTFSVGSQGAEWSCEGFSYDIFRNIELTPGEEVTLDVFFGIGYEEVAAATSAKELLRQGFDALLARSRDWLAAREKDIADEKLRTLLNTNMFFTLFYACGRTIDTEEICLMTSRSPRYYVSAAYWDRDSLLWAFPALLMADATLAKEALTYVFTKQKRNLGVHSRYIDGVVLEPGFEMDELCAPVIALWRYMQETGDHSFAEQYFVQEGLRSILKTLKSKKHSTIDLYETFLQPTDDMHNYPYLTYDNVLVWRSLKILAEVFKERELDIQAEKVQRAIWEHCVKEYNGESVFAWSVDLKGRYDIYDEPPGSLQLLSFYGFCPPEDAIWQNTLAVIRSGVYEYSFAGKPIAEIGCAHAPHPWVLSMCNSLLAGFDDSALMHLSQTTLDNGIACESVDEYTGECVTGEAFATCAGFLSYALWESAKKGGSQWQGWGENKR